MDEVKRMLDELADLRIGVEAIRLSKQSKIDQVITPEIKDKLEDIEDEYRGALEDINSRIAVIELDIKNSVLKLGESVKSVRLHAIWNKGRDSWDTKKLDGYSKAHPEIQEFKKEGDPYVTIRNIGG